jgi:Gpi18-like mannosyltransferase
MNSPSLGCRCLRLLKTDPAKLVAVALAIQLAMFAIGYLSTAAVSNPDALQVSVSARYLKDELRGFSRADVWWYRDIARNGYERTRFVDNRHVNWVFFPSWPVILRICGKLFSRMLLPGMIVSNVLFLFTVVGLYRLIAIDFGAEVARLSTLLLITFPATYFCWRPGPEALFVFLIVASLWCARMNRWIGAGLLGALATLTRSQGILLLPTLAYIYYRQYRSSKAHQPAALALLALPAALLGFMLYMFQITGNPLASFQIQRATAWDNNLSYPLAAIVQYIQAPRLIDHYGWDLTIISFLFALAAMGLIVVMIRNPRIPREYLIYTALSVYLIVSRSNLCGSLRYMVPIFPLFIVLALLILRRQMLQSLVFCGFVSLQTFYFIYFVQQYNWPSN